MATCTIIFDTETTSLDPKSNRIVSIAASCGDREFYTLVNPRCPIPRASTKVHGITNAEARLAPAWAVAGIRFWRWVEQVSPGGLRPPQPPTTSFSAFGGSGPSFAAQQQRSLARCSNP